MPNTSARATMLAAAAAAWLAACGVELTNRQPAQQVTQQKQPAGSVYVGWRVYQDRCARCHGPQAGGSAGAPDLTVALRTLSPRQFVAVVVRRYDWGLPAVPAGRDGGPGEALVDDVMQRRRGEMTMPEMQGEPRVNAHILDLYAYLAARSDGSLPPGRPVR